MNNKDAFELIKKGMDDLKIINLEITNNMNHTSRINKYLIENSIIKASACIEQTIKVIIADQIEEGANAYAKSYLKKMIRNKTLNPKYDAVINLIGNISEAWKSEVKSKISNHKDSFKLRASLDSIVTNRNKIAHGANSSASINDVKLWYIDSIKIVNIIDKIIY